MIYILLQLAGIVYSTRIVPDRAYLWIETGVRCKDRQTVLPLQNRSGMAISACCLISGSEQKKPAFCLNYVHCTHLSKRYTLLVSGFGRNSSKVHIGHLWLTALPFLQAGVIVSLPQNVHLTDGQELASLLGLSSCSSMYASVRQSQLQEHTDSQNGSCATAA